MRYNPSNWYWIVGTNTTQVWSSASASYVPTTDATYQAWSKTNTATKIDSESSLREVLSRQYPAGWPGGDLPQVIAAGLTVKSSGTPAIDGTYAINDVNRMDIIAIETSLVAGKGFPPGGGTKLMYPDNIGAFHQFDETNFTNFAAAVRDYYYACVNAAGNAAATKTKPTYPVSTITIP